MSDIHGNGGGRMSDIHGNGGGRMSDIVKRLRISVTKGHEPTDELMVEAADEIERLRRGGIYAREIRAEARAATIEECAQYLIAKADLLTNSLHCGDNSMTIAAAHRTSRIFYSAGAALRALKEQK